MLEAPVWQEPIREVASPTRVEFEMGHFHFFGDC
jgi:hypothetical protein